MNNNDFTLDIAHAHKLKTIFRRHGWTKTEIELSCRGNFFSEVLKLVRGIAEIKPIIPVIDCDIEPFAPNGWRIFEHKQGGVWEFDQTKTSLYVSKKQKNENFSGLDLIKEMQKKNQKLLNANVLDYLLAHPGFIPRKWRKYNMYFFGTIYEGRDYWQFVRCLYWNNDNWKSGHKTIGHYFQKSDAVAIEI